VRDGIDGFPDWLAVSVDTLQMGAEQFTGVGINVLDLQPVDSAAAPGSTPSSFSLLDVGIGVVVGEPGEEQVGEQVGAALLVGRGSSAPRLRAAAASMPSMAAAS
jgi:hypothetical protein